jgi:hypothetical protein
VDEFFLTSATLKLTLWKDNLKVEAKVFGLSRFLFRVLEVSAHQYGRG